MKYLNNIIIPTKFIFLIFHYFFMFFIRSYQIHLFFFKDISHSIPFQFIINYLNIVCIPKKLNFLILSNVFKFILELIQLHF